MYLIILKKIQLSYFYFYSAIYFIKYISKNFLKILLIMINKVIDGRFVIKEKIGAGSFGEVYFGQNLQTNEDVAIKIESSEIQSYQLYNESTIYNILDGSINIPKIYWFGTFSTPKKSAINYINKINKTTNVMAFELLGKSLKNLFNECNRRFSLKTVLMIVDQMLSTIQIVHSHHYVHRDLKPENFAVGLGNKQNQIYMIDFGLSHKYRDPQTLEHKPCLTNAKAAGTPRYTSINALKGLDQSRRDDMESLLYIWVYFLKGSLPWMGIPYNEKDPNRKYMTILHIKKHYPIEQLCSELPEEFVKYFNEVRSLKYRDEPDYAGYRKMFRDLFIELGYTYDYEYDWIIKEKSEVHLKSQKKSNIKIKRNEKNYYQTGIRSKSKRVNIYITSENILSGTIQRPRVRKSPSPERDDNPNIKNNNQTKFLSRSARRLQQVHLSNEKETITKIQPPRKRSVGQLPQIARESYSPPTNASRIPPFPKRFVFKVK